MTPEVSIPILESRICPFPIYHLTTLSLRMPHESKYAHIYQYFQQYAHMMPFFCMSIPLTEVHPVR